MLTRHPGAALAPDILVNAIAPGAFESRMMTPTLERHRAAYEAWSQPRPFAENSELVSRE
jgi:NAD(P)-dependent dehydrogenase (short-subunit alcohol dehydrogenase family)